MSNRRVFSYQIRQMQKDMWQLPLRSWKKLAMLKDHISKVKESRNG
ncbi:hypothetical protein HMPREF0454_01105 [Hafnia alvei ATCC 51873]|uniref:Uncharacterized protein n=1 Tax=Hafnia alvei ATCC 51873 TaxID=1002364 RepID=G9Y3L8_HAFAL|nr:hypothetical protein HMPREF0454_01105 [Hafnia alvei ATCC 51873]